MASLMGDVSRQTHAATFPPDRFYCLLDELPLHLIPQRDRRLLQEQESPGQLYLNPDCTIGLAEQIPDELASRRDSVSHFAMQGTIAWVRESTTGAMLPFWLGPELEKSLAGLHPGQPVPASMPANSRRLLTSAGILVPQERWKQHRAELEEETSKAALLFQEKGYAPLGNLIHPFHVAALRRYYRHLIRSGAIQLGDRQSERRYVAYNEPVARFFHQQITAKFSAIAGELLKPSYVYLASYLSGAELRKHKDREQCEFSITFCLDFSPEPELATPWPIKLDTPTGTVTAYQALGDGLAYRGTQLPHYRSVLPEGQTSMSIFFHYVAADFDGPLG